MARLIKLHDLALFFGSHTPGGGTRAKADPEGH
jgi:hypothetical protein